jgi:hypothetical protein
MTWRTAALAVLLAEVLLACRTERSAAVRVVALRQACDGGNLNGCADLGVMYANGTGVTKDEVRAVALYKQACDGGSLNGCANLGVMYGNGTGVPLMPSSA